MFQSGGSKSICKIIGTGITNGATGTANVDRLGYDYVSIDVIMGTVDATSNKPSTLKVAHCDTTVVTSFADVSGLVGGTDFTIPTASTSAENVYRFNIDCRGLKRYLRVSVTPLTTQAIVVDARLSRARELPISTTLSNTAVFVEV